MLNLNAFQAAYILDIVVIVALVVFALIEAKRGFITCVFGLVVSIVAFVVAIFCAANVAEATGGLFGLQEVISTEFQNTFKGDLFQVALTQEDLAIALADAKLPTFLIDMISVNGIEAEPGTTVAQYLAGEIAPFLTTVLTGIILFVLCKLLLIIVEKILTSLVSSISFLGAVNMILGAVVGLLKGGLAVCFIFSALSLLTSPELTEFINQSLFVHIIYNENPINLLYALII